MIDTNEKRQEEVCACETDTREEVGCDQEVWVRDQIITAMKMAIALKRVERVRAHHELTERAMSGIADGAAVEIIHTLGLRPSYVNIPRRTETIVP